MSYAHNRMKLMRSPNLVSLDPNDQDQVHAAAELHRELLSDSPVAQLGYRFMTKFYYSKLVEARLIRCDLYSYKGTYVAFSAYTKYPFTFMRQGKRRHFVYLSFLLFQSLLLGPRRLKTIFKVIGRSYRRGQDRKDKTGEVLSFGVLAPYRNLKDEVTGLRISNLLFERIIAYFKDQGFERIQGEIKKDNKPALFFWRSYGASICHSDWCNKGSYLASIELR